MRNAQETTPVVNLLLWIVMATFAVFVTVTGFNLAEPIVELGMAPTYLSWVVFSWAGAAASGAFACGAPSNVQRTLSGVAFLAAIATMLLMGARVLF